MGWPADVAASAHVFVEPADPAVGLPDRIEVGGEDGHHLARVLRLRPGETVTVADGSGGWRAYVVGEIGTPAGSGAGRGAVVRLDATAGPDREPALEPRLAVAFALTKGEKPELVVQKLTELGVDRIVPVLAERSVARPDAAKARVAVERWRRIAREAAGQCRRATLPVVEELCPLPELARHPGLVVAERGGVAAGALGVPPGGDMVVVVGPEGGLADAEVEALEPWARLDLGPHVLRAETAAIVAAALLAGRRRSRSGEPRAENPP